ncbi:flavodoxin [Fibrobacter sp. UWEL]|uniref:flavodoxin n=1 Tax=Fibrobacter sp. UWEL TaxID=1896209 RepID=UPI000914A9D3|nr:flavodoxin [Fibrobacter sp. UWEL]SHK63644.1 flavodoxin, short chain [Fibrobacter sp. UWEL]
MSKIAIVYWTGTGNTEIMANEIAAGARAAGADVSVFLTSGFTVSDAAEFDKFALGCPAMGAEELEDSEFLPLYVKMKPVLAGKKAVLFGSYGWGGGEYMNGWKEDATGAGLVLVDDPLALENAPDDDGKNKCQELGKVLALA